MGNKLVTNGGKHARIGLNLHAAIEKIKDARLLNGKSKERLPTEIITNLIFEHTDFKVIAQNIIDLEEEEVFKHGTN